MENYGIVILIMAPMTGASGLAGKLRLPVPVLLIIAGDAVAAIGLRTTVDDGRPFPTRNDILFLTIAVAVLSLLGQGLTLPWVVARFGKKKMEMT